MYQGKAAMGKKTAAFLILITFISGLCGAGGCSRSQAMTGQQLTVLNGILAAGITNKQVKTMEIEAKTARKFPAVEKMFKISSGEEYYAFLVSPAGYRAPINMMVVIDAGRNEVTGIKVMQQDETPGYGEWLAEAWFTDRFKGKSVDKYLQRVVLEAEEPNDIVQITSATITTQAVLNGVNSAMGVYRETILGQRSDPVPLQVEGYITESQPGAGNNDPGGR